MHSIQRGESFANEFVFRKLELNGFSVKTNSLRRGSSIFELAHRTITLFNEPLKQEETFWSLDFFFRFLRFKTWANHPWTNQAKGLRRFRTRPISSLWLVETWTNGEQVWDLKKVWTDPLALLTHLCALTQDHAWTGKSSKKVVQTSNILNLSLHEAGCVCVGERIVRKYHYLLQGSCSLYSATCHHFIAVFFVLFLFYIPH